MREQGLILYHFLEDKKKSKYTVLALYMELFQVGSWDFIKVIKMIGLALYLLLKNFSTEKTTCYPQVEAQILTKNETGNVRQNVLKVQQVFENAWCNECAVTPNLECKDVFTRGSP